jgi:NAD(P)-dependent dehydrogenase (short-subunit alcohol dehydrogenase family)
LRATLEALVVRAFERTSAFVPDMKTRGSSMTSAAPLRGLANYAMYVTARGAANSLAQTLAVELARHNIQVNAVAPNFIESPTYFPPSLMENPETRARILKNIPLGRLGRQEEAASLVAYLASPEADFLTGHVFPIAGGWA